MQLLKKTFLNPCVTILFISIIVFTMTSVLIIYTLINERCQLELFNNLNCYEKLGLYYINQFYTTTDNKTAMSACGPFMNCNQSCPFLNLDQTYYCSYFQNGLYQIYNNVFGIFLAVFATLMDVCLIVIFSLLISLSYSQLKNEYDYLNVPTQNLKLYNY